MVTAKWTALKCLYYHF